MSSLKKFADRSSSLQCLKRNTGAHPMILNSLKAFKIWISQQTTFIVMNLHHKEITTKITMKKIGAFKGD
jgi:hypothetical protein